MRKRKIPIIKVEIDVQELFDKEFENRSDLQKQIKVWSCHNKMKVSLKSQERENVKDGVKTSTFYCNKRPKNECDFFLEFKTDFKTKKYKLETYHNIHNHSYDKFDNANLLTEEIIKRINEFAKAGIETSKVTKLINQEFAMNFNWRTIYHQLRKAKDKEYGSMNKDALTLAMMLDDDVKARGGYYRILKDTNDQMLRCCWMTKRMVEVVNKFADVLIIDGSHKTNRYLTLFF